MKEDLLKTINLEIQDLESEAFTGSEFDYCERAGYIKGLKSVVDKIEKYEIKKSTSNKIQVCS
jgi:hypothetical protein